MDAALREHVRQRAGNTCEYCRIHQDQDPFFTFSVDHIIARQHGGKTESENLCLSLLSLQFSQGSEHREHRSRHQGAGPIVPPAAR